MKKKGGDATLMLLHTRGADSDVKQKNPGYEGIWQRQNVRILGPVVARVHREAPETVVPSVKQPFSPSTNPPDLAEIHTWRPPNGGSALCPQSEVCGAHLKCCFTLFIFYSCKKHPGH